MNNHIYSRASNYPAHFSFYSEYKKNVYHPRVEANFYDYSEYHPGASTLTEKQEKFEKLIIEFSNNRNIPDRTRRSHTGFYEFVKDSNKELYHAAIKLQESIRELLLDADVLASEDIRLLCMVVEEAHSGMKAAMEGNPLKLAKSAESLTKLSLEVYGKESPGWKAVGVALYTYGHPVLMLSGILLCAGFIAAFPPALAVVGGTSLVSALIGAACFTLTSGLGASLAGVYAFYKGTVDGPARVTGNYNDILQDILSDSSQDSAPSSTYKA